MVIKGDAIAAAADLDAAAITLETGRLARTPRTDGIETWAPFFFDDPMATVTDYLGPDARVALVDAEAVRAVPRLPRARAIVLAGALMGGDIEKAVREVREQGLLVVSLNMAGGVGDAADFVVTDPVQAGVMAVMAVADTARFQSDRLKRRVF